MGLNTTEEIIDDIRRGNMVILMDDEDRENEGDLILAAERVTPEHINFMARYARGLICLTLTEARCQYLGLPLMVHDNNAQYQTNFTVSIEAAEGVTTGISAADRARTVQVAVGRSSQPEDIVQPGHIFPLKAQPGGVLSRAGHTEAGCDLARLAGYEPASVIVEIMNEDGTMARRPQLEAFAKEHQLKIGTIADLIHYRMVNEHTVEKNSVQPLQTEFGEFQLHVYEDTTEKGTHLALVKGEPCPDEPCLVRVHQVDTLRDILHVSHPERHSWPLHRAMQRVAEGPCGVVVILNAGQRQQDVSSSLEQYFTGAEHRTTAKDGKGTYVTIGTGSQILRDLGVGKMRLLSSPMKFGPISGFDLEVVEYLSPE